MLQITKQASQLLESIRCIEEVGDYCLQFRRGGHVGDGKDLSAVVSMCSWVLI